MAVVAVVTGAITSVQYATLVSSVGWAARELSGATFHVADLDATGRMHVIEVWDSPEALEAFLAQRLLPTFAALNVIRPTVSVYQVGTSQANEAIASFVAMRSPIFVPEYAR